MLNFLKGQKTAAQKAYTEGIIGTLRFRSYKENKLYYLVMPLFVAIIKIGAISLSRALFKNEKLSISNIWTSSINNTCKEIKQIII